MHAGRRPTYEMQSPKSERAVVASPGYTTQPLKTQQRADEVDIILGEFSHRTRHFAIAPSKSLFIQEHAFERTILPRLESRLIYELNAYRSNAPDSLERR